MPPPRAKDPRVVFAAVVAEREREMEADVALVRALLKAAGVGLELGDGNFGEDFIIKFLEDVRRRSRKATVSR